MIKVTSEVKNDSEVHVKFTAGDDTLDTKYSILHPSFMLMMMNVQKMEKYSENKEKSQTFFMKFIEHFARLIGEDTISEISDFYQDNNQEFDLLVLMQEVMAFGGDDDNGKGKGEESTAKKS